jgi:capsular polysaccharide biosynthesis protein
LKRYIESAIRLKLRLLVCGILLFTVAWGGLYMIKAGTYATSATVWVEKPLYLQIDPTVSNPYISPAANQASIFNELLRTKQFTLSIAQKTGIPLPTENEQERVIEYIQKNLQVEASGTHLVTITCTGGKNNYCRDIINQSIQLFLTQLNTSRSEQAQAALQIYEQQLATYQEQMTRSKDELNKYLMNHPEALTAPSPNPTLVELQQQYNNDRARYDDIVAKIDNIKTESKAASEFSDSFFRIIDSPGDPKPYEMTIKNILLNSIIALVLAMLGVVALATVSTWTDRSIYSLSDIELVLTDNEEAPTDLVLGILPYNKKLAALRRRAEKEIRRKKGKEQERAPDDEGMATGVAAHKKQPVASPLLTGPAGRQTSSGQEGVL